MRTAEFAVPIEERYFEDYLPGSVYEYGALTVTEPEIIEFAKRFDPQAMHIDPEQAAQGRYGGIVASRWRPPRPLMRLFSDPPLSQISHPPPPPLPERLWPPPARPRH